MPLILAVSGAADLKGAIADVNRFLVILRQQHIGQRRADLVVGICLQGFDQIDLPAMGGHDLTIGVGEGASEIQGESSWQGIRIIETTTRSDVWSLWRTTEDVFREIDLFRQMHAVIRHLADLRSIVEFGYSPVFPKGEHPDSIRRAVIELRAQWPGLISNTWYIDDWRRGLVEGRAADEPWL